MLSLGSAISWCPLAGLGCSKPSETTTLFFAEETVIGPFFLKRVFSCSSFLHPCRFCYLSDTAHEQNDQNAQTSRKWQLMANLGHGSFFVGVCNGYASECDSVFVI